MPCYPKLCCRTKYTEPTEADECRCGLGASNGILNVLLSQLFLFVGLCFAAATIGDCGLVRLEEATMVRIDNTTATTLGMLSYRDAETDRCYWWTGDTEVADDSAPIANDPNETIVVVDSETTVVFDTDFTSMLTNDTYVTSDTNTNDEIIFYLNETLGQDWRVSIGLCGSALGLGVIIFLYSTSFLCSTQVKGFRIFLGALVGFLMPLLMAIGTVMVHQSEWCDIYGCSMGRSTIFSIVAAVCFVVSGIFYWTMENWPGQEELDDMEKKRTWTSEIHKNKRSSDRNKSRGDSPSNNHSNRSSRRTDHTGGTHYNDITSREIDDGSDNDFSVHSIEVKKPLQVNPPKRPSEQRGPKHRSSDFKKKKSRDMSDRSGSDRYQDEPATIRRARPRKNSNLANRDGSRRSGAEEGSSEMGFMNEESSNYLDNSRTVARRSSKHINAIQDLDSSQVAAHGDSPHIRTIKKIDDSRVADFNYDESSTNFSERSLDD